MYVHDVKVHEQVLFIDIQARADTLSNCDKIFNNQIYINYRVI